jgi:hypothetical protein
MNHFTTEHGDIIPFFSVIRVMNMRHKDEFDYLRIMFVNGSIDLASDTKEFMMTYQNWLECQ